MPTFDTELLGFGIDLPFDPKELWGTGRPPVTVTINGYTYRSTVAHMTGSPMLPLRKSNRDAAGVTVGDIITVTVELDTAPRVVEPPEDLVQALDRAGLLTAYRGKSFTLQREWAEGVTTAKRAETRERRIQACVEALTTGQ